MKWSRCVADIESGLILSRTHLGCPWVGNVCFGSHHNIETALLWASKMSKSCRILLSDTKQNDDQAELRNASGFGVVPPELAGPVVSGPLRGVE